MWLVSIICTIWWLVRLYARFQLRSKGKVSVRNSSQNYKLFERWIMLSTGYTAVQWVAKFVWSTLIHRIEINLNTTRPGSFPAITYSGRVEELVGVLDMRPAVLSQILHFPWKKKHFIKKRRFSVHTAVTWLWHQLPTSLELLSPTDLIVWCTSRNQLKQHGLTKNSCP